MPVTMDIWYSVPMRPRKVGGETRRAAHDGRDQFEERRIGLEQREKLHARRQMGQKTVELGEGHIGIGGRCQRRQQRRHQPGEQFAGAGASCQDDVFCRQCGDEFSILLDRERVVAREFRAAVDDRNFVLLHQVGDAR